MIQATGMREQTTDTAPLLVTIRDAARMLGVCERTVYLLTKAGQLPFIRIGRAVRYDRCDLLAFIDAGKQKETPCLRSA